MKIPEFIKSQPIQLAVGAIALIGFVYWLSRKTISDTVDTAQSILSGNNAVTKNQVDAQGNKITAYENAGVFGSLGAEFNQASGGWLSSIGEKLGEVTYDFFNPSNDRDKLTYIIIFPDGAKHAVNGSSIDDSGRFTYGGTRYRAVTNQANQTVAVAA